MLRRLSGVCIIGAIAGMIVLSIRENIGGAMTAGTIGAIASLCLIVGTAVATSFTGGSSGDGLAADIEARVHELVDAGVDQQTARSIVRKAVRLGESHRTLNAKAAKRSELPRQH